MKITFSYLVTTFFTSYLSAERGLSPNTIAERCWIYQQMYAFI